jgi:hypothetical protein
MRIAKARIVSVVQGYSQRVKIIRQLLLRSAGRFAEARADLPVVLECNIALAHAGKAVPYPKTGGWESNPQAVKLASRIGDRSGKLINAAPPVALGAIGADKGANIWEILPKPGLVKVKWILGDLVEYHDDGRFASEALNYLKPVIGVCIGVSGTPVQYDQLQGSGGKEE